MKKFVLSIPILFALFFVANISIAEAYTVDFDQISFPPYHVDGGYVSLPVIQTDNYIVCQKYKPAKSMLASYIDLPLGYSSGFPATVKVREASGVNGDTPGNIVLAYSATVNEDFWDGAKTFQRFYTSGGAEAAVNTSNNYWICLESEDVGLQWYYAKVDHYADGYAMRNFGDLPELKLSEDMGFRTYGYDPDPAPESPTEEAENENNDTSSTSGDDSVTTSNDGTSTASSLLVSEGEESEDSFPDDADGVEESPLSFFYAGPESSGGLSITMIVLLGAEILLVGALAYLIIKRKNS